MDWDDYAATWDEDDDARAYSAAAFQSLLRTCRELDFSLEGARVLDFGCGTGLLSEKLAARCEAVVAVDSSPKMIEALLEKITRRGLENVRAFEGTLSPEFVAGNAHFEKPFDIIVCSSVCAFLDDYAGSVAFLASHLRAGGLFVQWDWEIDPESDESFGLTREGIRAAHEGAGMRVHSIDVGFSLSGGKMSMAPLMGTSLRTQ